MIGSKPVRFLVLVLVAWGLGRTVAYRLVIPTTAPARAEVATADSGSPSGKDRGATQWPIREGRPGPAPIVPRDIGARGVPETAFTMPKIAFAVSWSERSISPRQGSAPQSDTTPTPRGHSPQAAGERREGVQHGPAHSPALAGQDTPRDRAADPPPLLAAVPMPRPRSSDRPAAANPAEMVAGKRWSGFAYVFHRPGGGGDPLVPVGQLGGSQVAARIAWRIAPAAPVALAVRASAALSHPRQAEVAPGVDILPMPALPVRFTIERRIAIGPGGRNAWSAFVAGGLYRSLGRDVDLDGYAQAGIVGAHRRDGFVDGAIRVAHRTRIADGVDLRLGGGLWGAAQPRVARIDIGPRAAVSARLPLPVTFAIEERMRIAGRARPGNGVALTLATDF